MFAIMLLQKRLSLRTVCQSLTTYLTAGSAEGIEPEIKNLYDGYVRTSLQQVAEEHTQGTFQVAL